MEEGSKDCDVFGVFEVRIVRPFWHGSASIGRWFCACFEEVCFGLSEIDGPSGFGVDVVGFLVSKRVKGSFEVRIWRFDADEKSVFVLWRGGLKLWSRP